MSQKFEKYNKESHGDFKKYYDTTQKRNYWVLGYFGGGSINILEVYELAREFSNEVGAPLETVRIDEVLKSRRYKGFKFIYSQVIDQKPEDNTIKLENVYNWLTD